jgi:predicted nucleotidyltransferase
VTDFERLVAALADADVEFVIVGGLAATVHGSARLTQDLDVVYSRSSDNIERLVNALAPLGPYLRDAPPGLPFEWSQDTVRRGLNFTLTTAIGDIDLLGQIAGGGDYDDLLPHVVDLELFGYPCKCLDLPRLIHVKRAAGRPKDLEAIAELEALLEERDSQEPRGR